MKTNRAKWRVLFGFFCGCFLVAGISGTLTAQQIPTWYASLAKPGFNPPNELFGPVWTVLYGLMAISAWLAWRTPESPSRRLGLAFFWLQLALNFAWSLLFFRLHTILLAAVEIIALWLAILATTLFFARIRRSAAWLMLPYLAWVAFATVLNWAIWRLNR